MTIPGMQEYQEQAREARRAAREDARQAAEEGNAIEPLSAVAQRRLKLDMPHELAGHLRPGVMSRTPHSLQDYQGTIQEIQVWPSAPGCWHSCMRCAWLLEALATAVMQAFVQKGACLTLKCRAALWWLISTWHNRFAVCH